jgi:hypothetical protein
LIAFAPMKAQQTLKPRYRLKQVAYMPNALYAVLPFFYLMVR